MNEIANTIDWKIGQLVSHDADTKSELYLMRVIGIEKDGRIKTTYHNRNGTQPFYINRKEVLHDPLIFGIEVK